MHEEPSLGVGSGLCEQMIKEFFELVRVDSESGNESVLADAVSMKLRELGFEVWRDRVGGQFGGQAGNVIGRLSSAGPSKEPILLCAHLDRVSPGNSVSPELRAGRIISGGETVLGADDVAGIVAILTGVRLAKASCQKLPPIEVVFTVCEERGLKGSKHLDYALLNARLGYVFDAARPVGSVITEAPTQIDFDVSIIGRCAHAAINPQDGISAIHVAAKAIAGLPFGQVDDRTTANIGVIAGGNATNVVCGQVDLRGEVRSHERERAEHWVREFADHFEKAAQDAGGSVEFKSCLLYQGYQLSENSEVVRRVRRAIKRIGRRVSIEASMGGTDANNLNLNGIESVAVGVGFEQVHSTRESIPVSELMAAGKLAASLIMSDMHSGSS